MLFWTHKPSSICVEECKLLLRILIGQQPITLLVLGQKQGCWKNWVYVNSTFQLFSTPSLFLFQQMEIKTRKEKKFLWTYIPLLSHPCPCVNVTPLSRFVHWPLDNYTAQGLGIIWRRLGPGNASSQNYLLSRHLHDNGPWWFLTRLPYSAAWWSCDACRI